MKTICLILFVIVSVSANAQNSPDNSNTVSALLKAVSTFEGPNASTIRSNAAIQLGLRADIKILIPLATSNPDPFVRKTAVAGLAFNADPSVTKALVAALQDRDAQVRETAGEGLELTAREIVPGEIEALVKSLDDEDAMVVAQVAGILYNQPGAADLAIPPIKKLLQSRNADLKEAATEALKESNNEDALGVFLHTLAIKFSEENGNKWTATFKVVDEVGRPIERANVSVIYYVPAGPNEDPDSSYREIKGLTDKNGIFVASHKDGSRALAFNVQKDGYYSANGSHEFIRFQDNDSSKWNPNVRLVLKRKIGQ